MLIKKQICGCSRRDFLRSGMYGLGVSPMSPGDLFRLRKVGGSDDHILVAETKIHSLDPFRAVIDY